MAQKTPGGFFKDIQAGKFKPVYYFFGEDDYRIIEAEKHLAKQFIPNRQLITNYRRFDSRKINLKDLLAELAVYPMLGEKQLIAVANFQSYKKEDSERIFKILTPPDPNRIVVLSSPAAKAPNKKSPFYKRMVEKVELVEFKKLSDKMTRQTVIKKLEKNGLKIEPSALTLLTELISGNRGALENETDKLQNYVQPGKKITEEDIKKVASGFEIYNVYALADHIIEGNSKKIVQQIRLLLADGNTPTGILFFVGKHFINLYLARNNKFRDSSKSWINNRYRIQAKKFEIDRLEDIIIQIALTDSELRHNIPNPSLTLETLALKLSGEKQEK
ncbi:MAG: DNA polymerase III subunit delta [candidate division Zixibacteria bacterium]|nr:DNA polymerase III subunit delta [candidate division Zixibacteria bacterium]MDD5426547.1 DNA polymerase III subunit delta [candidate division Zixibacteria bacterium]